MVERTGNVFRTGRDNGSSWVVEFVDFREKVDDWSAGGVVEKVED